MSSSALEYDVFISFAAVDQPLVTPIWQDLCASGLRVFWSDEALRVRVGNSWFEVIQESLERSRHMLLVCTSAALSSHWVKREYIAFYNQCYRPPSRMLVPMLAPDVSVADLPFLLREIEVCYTRDPKAIRHLCDVFGGTDLEILRHELIERNEEVSQLREKIISLQVQLAARSQIVTEDRDLLAQRTDEVERFREALRLSEASLASITAERLSLQQQFQAREVELKKTREQLAKTKLELRTTLSLPGVQTLVAQRTSRRAIPHASVTTPRFGALWRWALPLAFVATLLVYFARSC